MATVGWCRAERKRMQLGNWWGGRRLFPTGRTALSQMPPWRSWKATRWVTVHLLWLYRKDLTGRSTLVNNKRTNNKNTCKHMYMSVMFTDQFHRLWLYMHMYVTCTVMYWTTYMCDLINRLSSCVSWTALYRQPIWTLCGPQVYVPEELFPWTVYMYMYIYVYINTWTARSEVQRTVWYRRVYAVSTGHATMTVQSLSQSRRASLSVWRL